nr:MAG TPA: hypothetical protein [Caudoviricetes sp.]
MCIVSPFHTTPFRLDSPFLWQVMKFSRIKSQWEFLTFSSLYKTAVFCVSPFSRNNFFKLFTIDLLTACFVFVCSSLHS